MAFGKPPKGNKLSPVILVSTLVCAILLITFNSLFSSRSRSWLTEHSNASIAPILDVFAIPSKAHATQYSDECFRNTSLVFDTHGKACIDFDFAAKEQGIYAVKTPEVTYAYCSIPKNGCTYHLALMHRLLGSDFNRPRDVHYDRTHFTVSGDELERIIRDRGVPKYLVVRNPLARVLSAYLDKIERGLPAEQKTAESFEEWVYDTLHPGMEQVKPTNPHWKPQIALCGFGMRDLWREFRWFKVEEPEEYVNFLERVIPQRVMKDGWNGTSNSSFREATLGPRKRTGRTSEIFFKYVRSLRLFDYLASCYALDIDGLGYRDEVSEMRKQLVGKSSS